MDFIGLVHQKKAIGKQLSTLSASLNTLEENLAKAKKPADKDAIQAQIDDVEAEAADFTLALTRIQEVLEGSEPTPHKGKKKTV